METTINKLKAIKSVNILANTNKFISISFDLKDKLKVVNSVDKQLISIHTQDNLTTATILLKEATNVEQFIYLQDKANLDIDMLGSTTDEIADELNRVGDLLTDIEINEVLTHYENKRK
jgi:protein-arginine kinase